MPPTEPDASDATDRGAPPTRAGEGEARLHVQGDDELVLETVFRAEYAGLCAFAERYVRSAAVAEELVQGIFLRLWRRRDVVPVAHLTRAYLYASARNAAIQHIRHERLDLRWHEVNRASGRAEPPVERADELLMAGELAEAVDRAIASLPDRCRLIYTLSRQQGLRYSEIAEALGISPGTVEIQMNRALKALRTKLAPYLLLVTAVLR